MKEKFVEFMSTLNWISVSSDCGDYYYQVYDCDKECKILRLARWDNTCSSSVVHGTTLMRSTDDISEIAVPLVFYSWFGDLLPFNLLETRRMLSETMQIREHNLHITLKTISFSSKDSDVRDFKNSLASGCGLFSNIWMPADKFNNLDRVNIELREVD